MTKKEECYCGCHFSDFAYRGGIDCAMCGDKHKEDKRRTEVPICPKCKIDDGHVGYYPSGWVCEVCGDIEPEFIMTEE